MAADANPPLDPRIASLIGELRGKIRRYITFDSVLAAVAVVLIFFWVGLLLDLLPVKLGGTEMPRSARAVLLIGALVALAVVFVRLFLGRITRRLPADSLALLIERHHPSLAGRLITTVQLSGRRQPGDLHADALLNEVHRETSRAAAQLDTRRIFRMRPLWTKASVVLPLGAGLAALGLLAPGTLKQATARLLLASDTPWPRQADLRMVGVEVPLVTAMEETGREPVRLLEFEDRVVRVARGGGATLRILARSDGAKVPEICTLYYETESGVEGQVNMRRVGRVRDGFQAFALDGAPLAGITEDLEISIRGLDDRLDGYKILAVDAPNIASLRVEATYPEYLREDGFQGPDRTTDYQPGLRLREGSTIRLVGQSSTPVAVVEAAVTSGDQPPTVVPVDVAEDGQSFSLALADVRSPTTVVMVPVDADQISAPSPYRYFLGVVTDAPPEIELRLPGIGQAVTPAVRIPLEGAAADDYGVSELSIQLAKVGESTEVLHSVTAQPNRDGEFESVLDIRDLADAGTIARPEPGDQWNVFAEAKDAYDLGDRHIARSDMLRLDVVTPEELLATLERRELGLRARLEQTISEVEGLRESLDLIRREGWEAVAADQSGEVTMAKPGVEPIAVTPLPREIGPISGVPSGLTSAASMPPARTTRNSRRLVSLQDSAEPPADRAVQLLQLRIQQAGLQASKTAEELTGIAAAVDDILLEMTNNRVDTPDRSERIATGVRDPLVQVVDGSLSQLRSEISGLLDLTRDPGTGPVAAQVSVETSEQVLLQLQAVLERMLDLESYNEVLDLVRGLIDNQEALIEATEEERKRALRDLFRP